MNDLLSNLDADPQAASAQPTQRSDGRVWRAIFIEPSSARLERDWGEMLTRLAKEGFEVHVIAPDDGGLVALEERGVLVSSIPPIEVEGPARLATIVGAFFILQAYLIEHPSALVHARGAQLAWLAAAARSQAEVGALFATIEDHRWLASTPCASPHTPVWRRLGAALAEATREAIPQVPVAAWRWLGQRLDSYITITQHDLKMLTERRIVIPEKVEVLMGGQGVPLSRFDPRADTMPSAEEARAQLEVPSSWRHVLGVAGKIEAPEEIAALIARTARYHPAAGWLIATPPAGLDPATRRVLKDAVDGERAMFVEPGLDMPRFYRACDFFVALRYSEGIPSTVLEAQALHLPVVGTDTTGIHAVISPEDTSTLLADPGDLDAHTDHIKALLDEPSAIAIKGDRARTYVRQRFGREDAHDQLLGIFDRVLTAKYGEGCRSKASPLSAATGYAYGA